MSSNLVEFRSNNESVIYQVKESPSKTLEIFSGRLNQSFSKIQVNGESPPNRKRFSLSQYGDSMIVMVGGYGFDIEITEVWLFDTALLVWKKLETDQEPIPCRSGHCSSVYGNYIYVFGGTNGLNISHDLIIITIHDNNKFSYKFIEEQINWPPARVQCTMTQMNSTIWIFGGQQMDGSTLNDLWELDYSLFPQSPTWHAIELKRCPPGRHSHVAWVKDGEFYVAGGNDDKNNFLNEVWSFRRSSWEQTAIFDPNFPIFPCNGILVELGDQIKEAVLKNLSAALDSLFQRLKYKQSIYSKEASFNNEKKRQQFENSQRLKYYENLIDQNRQANFQEIRQYFAPQEIEKLKLEIRKNMDQLTETLQDILANYPKLIKTVPINTFAEELNLQLTLKLQQDEKKYKKAVVERENEKQLYQQQIALLKNEINGKIKVPESILTLDPSNYDSFLNYVSFLSKENKDAALKMYYSIQLQEYQKLKQQTEMIKKKVKISKENQAKRMEMANKLSDDLTRKFKIVTNADDSLIIWKTRLDEVNEDLKNAELFNKAAELDISSNGKFLESSNFKSLEQEQQNVLNALRIELKKITDKAPYIQAMNERIRSIMDLMKTNEGIVDLEYDNLVKIYNMIQH